MCYAQSQQAPFLKGMSSKTSLYKWFLDIKVFAWGNFSSFWCMCNMFSNRCLPLWKETFLNKSRIVNKYGLWKAHLPQSLELREVTPREILWWVPWIPSMVLLHYSLAKDGISSSLSSAIKSLKICFYIIVSGTGPNFNMMLLQFLVSNIAIVNFLIKTCHQSYRRSSSIEHTIWIMLPRKTLKEHAATKISDLF